jgi:Tfp pilus assembly pilus retraction ATPase PilT
MNYQEELNDLLSIVAREGGSDIHLSEGRHPTIRINGSLLPLVKKNILHQS